MIGAMALCPQIPPMSPFVPQGNDGIDWGDGEKGQEGTITAEPSAQVCDTLEGPGCPQIPPDVTQCHPLFLRGMMASIGAMERRDRRGQSRFWRLGLRVSRAGQGFLGAPIIWGDAELDLGSHPCPLPPPPTSQTQRDLGMGQREGFGCWGGGLLVPWGAAELGLGSHPGPPHSPGHLRGIWGCGC